MKMWLNVAEAAEYAGVSRNTICTACEGGDVPNPRVRGHLATPLRRRWIDRVLEQHVGRGRTDANTPPWTSASAQFVDCGTERTMTLGGGDAVNGASHLSLCRRPRECYDAC